MHLSSLPTTANPHHHHHSRRRLFRRHRLHQLTPNPRQRVPAVLKTRAHRLRNDRRHRRLWSLNDGHHMLGLYATRHTLSARTH